jgi:type II secretory pathway component GspD/PulD (secretin)
MKRILILTLAMLPLFGFAQGETKADALPQTVSVSSKGEDVRSVLHDLFSQSKKSFVLQPNIRFVLYLSLKEIEFEEALQLICTTAGLKYEVQNGIYFVSNAPKPKPEPEKQDKQEKPEEAAPALPKGKLPESVLQKRLTTKFQKTDIRLLFADIAKQTGVALEVATSVPAYKLDAFLNDTSLKFALDTVCKAAGLEYKFTDNQSILIAKPEKEANRVAIN